MSLSSRAQEYLATLHRGPFVPAPRVAEALKQAGAPVLDVWLDFHARYAGYEESLGEDQAVWGIVHEDPYWLGPMEAAAHHYGSSWEVVCAEVHPSYDYMLREDGEFASSGGGGRCESFDLKIERDAVAREALMDGRPWQFSFELMETAGEVERLCRLAGAEVIPEASDRYVTTWRAPDLVVMEHRIRSAGTLPGHAWVAVPALNGLLARLRGR